MATSNWGDETSALEFADRCLIHSHISASSNPIMSRMPDECSRDPPKKMFNLRQAMLQSGKQMMTTVRNFRGQQTSSSAALDKLTLLHHRQNGGHQIEKSILREARQQPDLCRTHTLPTEKQFGSTWDRNPKRLPTSKPHPNQSLEEAAQHILGPMRKQSHLGNLAEGPGHLASR